MPTAQVVTITEQNWPSVKKIVWDWLCTDGGVVSSATTNVYDGALLSAVFTPDAAATQPTNGYDVTILDAGNTDVLSGLGADLSNSATVVKKHTDGLAGVSASKLTLTIANAGDAKGGVVTLLIR